MNTLHRVYHAGLRRALVTMFPALQALGIHVTQNYFYEPVPDTRALPDSLWSNGREMAGVRLPSMEEQEEFLECVVRFRSEYENFPTSLLHNRFLCPTDMALYYGVVRAHRPNRIVEIGAGISTILSCTAVEKNGCGSVTAIDPYPAKIVPKEAVVIPSPVQDVPLSKFAELQNGDILFIDSSHVAKIGSDVLHEILEILPRLNLGVLIHFHDILLPAHYPRHWVLNEKIFWNEQYILQAFLAFNDRFQILFASNFTHRRHPEVLERYFSGYNKNDAVGPGSFWIKRVG
jgi:predicted O-methyltransferase YrrM